MARRAASLLLCLMAWSSLGLAGEPAAKSPRKTMKLPGLVVDFQERCVDVEATVCLEQGLLELIACTEGSKEHESIIAIAAKAMHVHTALLLLGANPGHPAMRKPVDEEETRWIDVPPSGDLVDVYLVFRNGKGKVVERPVSDFVAPSDGMAGDQPDADEAAEFPHTFVFAGSLLRSNGQGPRQYLSDLSGNVISIATFGDELLCLPGIHGQQNAALMWQVDPTGLPKVGTKVILRLRPRVRAAPQARRDAKGTDGEAQ